MTSSIPFKGPNDNNKKWPYSQTKRLWEVSGAVVRHSGLMSGPNRPRLTVVYWIRGKEDNWRGGENVIGVPDWTAWRTAAHHAKA